jgi:hypothetical protein
MASRHKEAQGNEYQFNNLCEYFVPWCLCGRKRLFGAGSIFDYENSTSKL